MTDEEISTKLIRMGYRKKMMRSSMEKGVVYAYYEHPSRNDTFSFWGSGEWLFCHRWGGTMAMRVTRSQMAEKLGEMQEDK